MTAHFLEIFAGDHYCKLLSPFRALEWIYVDSLYDQRTLGKVISEQSEAQDIQLIQS